MASGSIMKRLTLLMGLLLAVLAQAAVAQVAKPGTATVAAVVGGVELRHAGGGSWQLAVVGSALFVEDSVRTRPASRAKLAFNDGSVVDW